MPQQYELTRPLGRGGFGLVYEAIDHKLRRRVAIKMMRAPSASSLYQLKREFRVAADFSHPNLVELHELVVSGLSCFVVMELIDGVGFLVYVRGGAHPDASNADTAPERDRRRLHPRVELDLDRLRGTLAQLVDAVQVLHDAGRIHRDIKPSNVLCTAAGRVVLVDFGLACVAARIDEITEEHRGAGTPAYMSPEQALGLPLEPATDWYSVGVLLYEALTGRHPYGGRGLEVIPIHHAFAPVPPERMSDAPRDLSDLAMALLRMEPHERPDGHEIARRLGRGPSRWPRPSSPRIVDFVGRRTEVAALETLLAKTEQRTPTIARVSGRPELVRVRSSMRSPRAPAIAARWSWPGAASRTSQFLIAASTAWSTRSAGTCLRCPTTSWPRCTKAAMSARSRRFFPCCSGSRPSHASAVHVIGCQRRAIARGAATRTWMRSRSGAAPSRACARCSRTSPLATSSCS